MPLPTNHRHVVQVFGGSSGSARMDSLFSSDWRARETALNDIAREAISLLLPHSSGGVGDHTLSGLPVDSSISGHVTPPRVECHRVQQVCMDVVKHSCADSVLKVFLAALVSTELFDVFVVVLFVVCCCGFICCFFVLWWCYFCWFV